MTGQRRCCGDRESNKPWSRLGACPKCIRLSALGAGAGWIVYGVVNSVVSYRLLSHVALVVAVAFALLLAAHIAAFFIRAARAERDATPEGEARDRRGFLTGAAVALGAVLVAPLAGLSQSQAVAQESPPKKDPCEGKCTFTQTVEYDAEDAGGGKVTVTRFSLKSGKKSDAKGCSAEVNFAPGGVLEFKVQGEAACKIETVQDFLNAEKNCGAKTKGLTSIEKKGTFESIKLTGIHEVTCNPNDDDCNLEQKKGTCQGPENVQTFSFNFKFDNGEVTHDGTVQKPKEDKPGEGPKPGKGPKKVVVTWEKILDCKATCK